MIKVFVSEAAVMKTFVIIITAVFQAASIQATTIKQFLCDYNIMLLFKLQGHVIN